jgi:hypothetical protein
MVLYGDFWINLFYGELLNYVSSAIIRTKNKHSNSVNTFMKLYTGFGRFQQRLTVLRWSAVHQSSSHEKKCQNNGLHDDYGLYSFCLETE